MSNEDSVKTEKKETSTKTIIVRCVAAVLCSAMACGAISISADDYSKAIIKEAELMPIASGNNQSGIVYSNGGSSYSAEETGGSVADVGGEAVDGQTNEFSVETTTVVTSTTATTTEKSTKSADKMTKAEIINLFNNAANGAKTNAKSIKQNYSKNAQVTGIELKNKTLAGLADSLIAANVGEDESKHDVTYTGTDKEKNFPVAGQSWASKLTEADVKSAEIKESGNTYNVVIKLVDDTQDNLKAGEGHAGKAISLITKEQIVEGAGSVGMAVIEENSIKVRHSGAVIKATVDKATGKLKAANYYRVWRLSLTALGIDIALSFSVEEDFTINW